MAFTGSLIVAGVSVGASLVAANQAKQAQKGQQAALNRSLDASTAAIEASKPPDVLNQQGRTAAAMTAAAARQRALAKGAGGFGSTILTSPAGAPQAPTAHKQLLGL